MGSAITGEEVAAQAVVMRRVTTTSFVVQTAEKTSVVQLSGPVAPLPTGMERAATGVSVAPIITSVLKMDVFQKKWSCLLGLKSSSE